MEQSEEEKTRIDLLKFELQEMYTWKRLHAQLRRKDLVLFSGLQGVVIGVISDSILNMSRGEVFLSIFAFVVAGLGYLISHRAGAYVDGFTDLAAKREEELGISLSKDLNISREKRYRIFPRKAWQLTTLIHGFILLSWIIIWLVNVLYFFNIVSI